jgi:hypothetical protein
MRAMEGVAVVVNLLLAGRGGQVRHKAEGEFIMTAFELPNAGRNETGSGKPQGSREVY